MLADIPLRRQAMMSNTAWQRHGCYKLGSVQYFNMPLDSALLGCKDDWNSLDHFDPTADMRLLGKQFLYLRTVYASLQDGFNLVQRGNWTSYIQRPGSNGTATEMGLWSVSRSGIDGVQQLNGTYPGQVWMLYSNMNTTFQWSYDCKGSLWISTPYQAGVTVRNLLSPYENYTLAESGSSFYANGTAPYFGCMSSVTLDPFGMKVIVPADQWVPPLPMLTGFLPGHDARIQTVPGSNNATTLDIVLEFNVEMACDSVTNSLTLSMSSSGIGASPTVDATTVFCGAVAIPVTSTLNAAPQSSWKWTATLRNVPDGILELILSNPTTADGTASTGVSISALVLYNLTCGFQSVDHLLVRKGTSDNPLVFPYSDYDNSLFQFSNGQYQFTHKAYGADMFRYSGNYGKSWSGWSNWENVTVIPSEFFTNGSNFWTGQHVMVQCGLLFFLKMKKKRHSSCVLMTDRLERRRGFECGCPR